MVLKSNSMEFNRRKVVIRVVSDLISIGCVAIPVLLLFLLATPYHRGFYCDDESLMHPHKKNTIPTWIAGAVGIALPTAALLILEGVKTIQAKKTCLHYVVACYQLLIPFYFGGAVCQLTTDIAKYSVGRLRPHFFAVCQANIASCTSTTGFIDGDVCTGTDKDAIEEARLSFPSGHSSVSFYTMIWVIVYLQFKFTWRRYWLVRPLLQAICFFMAYYTGLSRISDYMHHWSDVLAGSIIGIVVAILNIFFMSNLLPWKEKKCHDCSNDLPMYGHQDSQQASNNRNQNQDF